MSNVFHGTSKDDMFLGTELEDLMCNTPSR